MQKLNILKGGKLYGFVDDWLPSWDKLRTFRTEMIYIYKSRLNLEHCTFSRIEHEDAIVASVYRVTEPNDAQYILKICSRSQDYLREIYFLKYFRDVLPVPQIINIVEPDKEVHGAILMQCLPGTLLQKTLLTEELAYEIGAVLAHIHLNRTEYYGDLVELSSLNLDSRKYFTFKFEEGLMECENHFSPALSDQCRQYYDAHIDLLASVDGACLIHRDFRPGNIITNNGKLQGIIDWSSARSGFAEDDFCPWGSSENGESSLLIKNLFLKDMPVFALFLITNL